MITNHSPTRHRITSPQRPNLARPLNRTRRGISLTEVLIAMSTTSLVFFVVILTIHQSYHLGSQQRRRENDSAHLDALNRDWRRDVSAARSVAWSEAAQLEIVTESGATVRYSLEDASVVRTVDDASQVHSLSDRFVVQWTRNDDEVSLHLRRRPIHDAAPVEFRVWSVEVK